MSSNASASPLSRNHWNESRWMAIRSGRGRASSILANEKRSGLWDRAGNGLLLAVGMTVGLGSGIAQVFDNIGNGPLRIRHESARARVAQPVLQAVAARGR